MGGSGIPPEAAASRRMNILLHTNTNAQPKKQKVLVSHARRRLYPYGACPGKQPLLGPRKASRQRPRRGRLIRSSHSQSDTRLAAVSQLASPLSDNCLPQARPAQARRSCPSADSQLLRLAADDDRDLQPVPAAPPAAKTAVHLNWTRKCCEYIRLQLARVPSSQPPSAHDTVRGLTFQTDAFSQGWLKPPREPFSQLLRRHFEPTVSGSWGLKSLDFRIVARCRRATRYSGGQPLPQRGVLPLGVWRPYAVCLRSLRLRSSSRRGRWCQWRSFRSHERWCPYRGRCSSGTSTLVSMSHGFMDSWCACASPFLPFSLQVRVG